MTQVTHDPLDALKERSEQQPFRGFVCWDENVVSDVINPEAAAPSTEVLLATHQPVPIARLDVSEAGRLRPLDAFTEQDVLEVVKKRSNDPLIVPVIGPSGSGKSHFVLWLKAQLELEASEAPAASRRLVHVEKGELSLSSVIEKLLMDERGEEFDALLDSVRKASAALDEEQAALLFRNALAYAIQELARGGRSADEEREYALAALPALLYDDTYARHLLKPDSSLRRAARAALGEREDETPEARFEHGDLPVTLHGEENKLGEAARLYLAAMNDARQAAATYTLLNEVRDDAMRRVFGVEPNQLVRVMADLRKRLFDRDPNTEIVLLIEDFTLLQGVQYELLEAMLDLPRRGGRQIMCELRAVIAVTRDRFTEILAHSDTLRTRLQSQGHIYSIDLRLGDDQEEALDREGLAAFAARYLNAARLGPEVVGKYSPEVPNACEWCENRPKCHAAFGDAAGSGESGFGLYPFSRRLLEQLTVARGMRVNPRALLDTVRTTLVDEADALRHGRFPRDAWAEALLPADPALREEIELPFSLVETLKRTDAGERRVWLQTFWSSERGAATDVDAAIHEAFAIPPLGTRVEPKPEDEQPDTSERQKPRRTDPLQRWVSEGDLKGDLARRLRRQLRELIVQRAGGTGLLLSAEEFDRVFPEESIRIDGAEGGGHLGQEAIRMQFDRSPETGVFFQQVLTVEVEGWSAVEAVRLPEFVVEIQRRADELASFLEGRRREWESSLGPMLHAQALGGLAFGKAHEVTSSSLLAGAIDTTAAGDRAQAWLGSQVAADRAVESHRRGSAWLLRYATAARAVGSSAAVVDASPFLRHLEELRATWAIPSPEEVPDVARALTRGLSRLVPAVDAAERYLNEWAADMRQALDDGSGLTELVERIDRTGARVRRRGLIDISFALPAHYDVRARELLPAVEAVISTWQTQSLGDRIVSLLKLDREQLDELLEATRLLTKQMDDALSEARRQVAAGRGQDASGLSQSLVTELERLRSDVEGLRDESG